ncbi:hypothetical protein ACFLSP_01685 [Bacteroidota bacterium]
MTGYSIRNILGIIFLSTLVQGIHAQYIEVKTELDTNQIRIGEPLNLDIWLHQPAGISVEFPVIEDTIVKNLEIINSWPADTILLEGDLEILKRYRLTSFDSGLYVVPPMKFFFSSDVWTDSIESNPLYLYVHTVQVDSTIYDVKSPIHMPVGFLEVFPFILGGIIVLIAVGFLLWYLRRRKKNKPLFGPPKPKEPAHIIAFRELRELKDEKLWQNMEFKKYYTRLTEIIRRYMERRYGIQAMELTSHEILEEWTRSGEDKEDLSQKLKLLLNLADLVKFAKQKPVASENEENMERAYEFVELTKWEAPEIEEE